MSDKKYVRGFSEDSVRVPKAQRERYAIRLRDAEIIGVCPVDGCERELSRQEIETRQHELNHLEGKTKRVAGTWLKLTHAEKAEMAEFIGRS